MDRIAISDAMGCLAIACASLCLTAGILQRSIPWLLVGMVATLAIMAGSSLIRRG